MQSSKESKECSFVYHRQKGLFAKFESYTKPGHFLCIEEGDLVVAAEDTNPKNIFHIQVLRGMLTYRLTTLL